MTVELVSYADLKSMLDLEGEAITDYPALGVIRDSVVSAIEEYLRRLLEKIARTHTMQYYYQTRMIRLAAVPVSTITSFTLTTFGSTQTLTSDDYLITDYGLALHTPVNGCLVTVIYTGGYLAADVPAAIKRAALLQTAYEFQGKDQIGASTVSNDGGSITRPSLQLLPEVRRMLDPHKHPLSL